MKLRNKDGSILIVAYVALYALITLSAGLALFNFNELNYARRHHNTVAAFWLAEAGANMFMQNTTILDSKNAIIIDEGIGAIRLEKDDSDPAKRVVTSTGIVGKIKKSVQVSYPANPPEVFKNTMSVKGNVEISGKKSAVTINDRTQISGELIDNAKYSNVLVEEMKEKVNPKLVTMTYPDVDGNGVADEFSDFVAFNRNLLENYPKEEVLYIKGNGTYTITPSSSIEGKKVIYIEGDENKGNVIIQFGGGLKKDQKVTLISTGTVTYNQAGWAPSNSQLNVISWTGYTETAALPGSHNGMIYTHGEANFDDIYDTSITNGGIVANEGLTVREAWSMKTFNYAETTNNNAVPVGFQGLIGGGTSGYTSEPISWKSI